MKAGKSKISVLDEFYVAEVLTVGNTLCQMLLIQLQLMKTIEEAMRQHSRIVEKVRKATQAKDPSRCLGVRILVEKNKNLHVYIEHIFKI